MKISEFDIHDSLRKSGRIPVGWRPERGGVRKVAIKNREILNALRQHHSGEWRKVYRRGIDGTEIHYFEHQATGKVWGIKIK
jgi:hypothetical protein